MNKKSIKRSCFILGLGMLFLIFGMMPAEAKIDGITGTLTPAGREFNLLAVADYISTADGGPGGAILFWGFTDIGPGGSWWPQYPGPTLIVNQGETVIVRLRVDPSIPMPVSIVFPAHTGVVATGGDPGLLTQEAPNDGSTEVTYTFIASQPGTYTYYSGTRPDLQIEMGLVGTLIVRPAGFDPANPRAYSHPDSAYKREYLFFLSEMDPSIHEAIEFGYFDTVDTTTFWPVYWFINGRTAPDTMDYANVPWLPTQPYNCMPSMKPGEKVLLRIVGGGRDSHPFHTHGNHVRVIARDGRLLQSSPGVGADLSRMEFTVTSVPGQTVDAIFTWTGEKMGWDIYGHTDPTGTGQVGSDCTAPSVEGENIEDHCKPLPVIIPPLQNLTFGGWYSGSPFLGAAGTLPPGEGGLNPNAGFFFMWHSHNENEIVNNNIFPGGMLTMAVVEHPDVEIME